MEPLQVSLNYTPLADPLLAFVSRSRLDLSGTAASLLTPINYNADLFATRPQIITANYGFDGYLGIPGMNGTDAQSQAIASAYNVAWETLDPSLGAVQRAYTSAVSTDNMTAIYGVNLLQADTIPVVFSYPVLPTRVSGSDFAVTLSDGKVVTPDVAAFLPNLEFNERQTVVLAGSFGNRLRPGEAGALYPTSVTVVNDGSPLEVLGPGGPVSAVGFSVASANPYVTGNGPKLVAAKLNHISTLGEGGPLGVGLTSQNNSGSDLYGSRAQYRLRLYTSAGFSPDGIASLLPTEFSRYFILQARDALGGLIEITQTGVPVTLGSFGTITVLGLADLSQAGAAINAGYVEDHDNYYDVILEGDQAAISRLTAVRMPSSGQYQAVYNPGGPGNDPSAPGAAPGPFTVPSADHTVTITNDLNAAAQVTLVEVDGPVLRNPWSNQLIGSRLGVAVSDTVSGQTIDAYQDPQGRRFYASFAATSSRASTLPVDQTANPAIDLINTTRLAAGTTASVQGSLSRSASFDATLEFYSVADTSGAVRDPLSGLLLQPGDPGYSVAARNPVNRLSAAGGSLQIANLEVLPFNFSLAAGQILAPMLTLHGSGETYFAFAAANGDGGAHFTSFGPNAWGIEDQRGLGDRDYDDCIVRFALVI